MESSITMSNLHELTKDLSNIKRSIHDLRSDVNELKLKNNELKCRVNGLELKFDSFKSEGDQMKCRVDGLEFNSFKSELDQMKFDLNFYRFSKVIYEANRKKITKKNKKNKTNDTDVYDYFSSFVNDSNIFTTIGKINFDKETSFDFCDHFFSGKDEKEVKYNCFDQDNEKRVVINKLDYQKNVLKYFYKIKLNEFAKKYKPNKDFGFSSDIDNINYVDVSPYEAKQEFIQIINMIACDIEEKCRVRITIKIFYECNAKTDKIKLELD